MKYIAPANKVSSKLIDPCHPEHRRRILLFCLFRYFTIDFRFKKESIKVIFDFLVFNIVLVPLLVVIAIFLFLNFFLEF